MRKKSRGQIKSAAGVRKKSHLLRSLILAAAVVLAGAFLWNELTPQYLPGVGSAGTSPEGERSMGQSTYATPAEIPPQEGRPLVCIDAGHGGKDQGSSWEGLVESEQNLALALALRDALVQRGMGVLLTRDTDVFVELERRAEIANQAGADYFISLHRNALESGGAQGIEIWHSHAAGEHTRYFASCVEEALVDAGVTKSRGCKGGSQASADTDYLVCRKTTMPAVLVEMGFITDEEDNRLFESKKTAYAEALADAVQRAWERKQQE